MSFGDDARLHGDQVGPQNHHHVVRLGVGNCRGAKEEDRAREPVKRREGRIRITMNTISIHLLPPFSPPPFPIISISSLIQELGMA